MRKKTDETFAIIKAREIIQFFKISQPDEIRLNDIAWSRGLIIKEAPLDSGEAWLVRKEGVEKGIIRVSEGIAEEGRKRFAIAHELGHWELHPRISQAHLFTFGDLEFEYKNSAPELEANIFASELLMPEHLFQPICDKDNPSIHFLSEISSVFRTSLTATALRFLNFCSEHCAIVFSQNGKIRRFKASKGFNFRIDVGQMVSKDSCAYDAFHDNPIPQGMQEVPYYAWFPEKARWDNCKVFEDSIIFRNYHTVMSLLWVPPEID